MKIMINLLNVKRADSQYIYTLSVVPRLISLDQRLRFIVFCDRNIKEEIDKNDNIEIVTIPSFWGATLRIIVVNFFLPIIFFLKKCNFVYSPNTIFPIILRKRNVVTVHDLSYLFYKKDEPKFSGMIMRIFYYFARFAHKIISISNSIKNELIMIGFDKNKIVTAYNALPDIINLKKTKANTLGVDGDFVVYVGMYRKRKNIERLIGSLVFVKNIKLVLIGSIYSKREYLESYAHKLGVKDRIFFTDFVSDDFKKKIISLSRAVIVPSLYEGFGFPVLEAQALGCPVVASDIPALKEVAGDSAVYFDPYNIKNISESINRIITDDKLRLLLIERGRQNIKRFNWETTAGIILNIFNHEK